MYSKLFIPIPVQSLLLNVYSSAKKSPFNSSPISAHICFLTGLCSRRIRFLMVVRTWLISTLVAFLWRLYFIKYSARLFADDLGFFISLFAFKYTVRITDAAHPI